ncbi:HEAT repeat domain-containing protein [Dactylosporangium sp. McL0621]|uniref:HEAT repeat domain-containing protein n=1 Tax=Dactylosporangium sp. McL0621 TaxID=3415678 RepID=UPI003CFAC0BE
MRHEDLLAETDWSAVEHACGRAPGVPQTPEILTALLSTEVATQVSALNALYDLVHHQDTLYTATPPAVDFVVAVLGDQRTLTPVPADRRRGAKLVPLRAELLGWLTSVMEAAAEHEQWPPAGGAAEIAACRAARPRVYQAARSWCTDPDPEVVAAALGTIACLLDAPELNGHRRGVAAWLHDQALASPDRGVRVMAVLMLDAWGYDTTPVLQHDPDPVVRATAALSAAHTPTPTATRAILQVLSAPADAAWCQQVFPHFGRLFPWRLLPAAIDRATLDDLVPALTLLLADPPTGTYAGDWGARLRRKAFPDGFPPSRPLSPAQRALLHLLAERCFGPAAPPVRFATDTRSALSDLIFDGAVHRGQTAEQWSTPQEKPE